MRQPRARGRSWRQRRRDAGGDVAIAMTAAPAQDVPRMLAAPAVNDLGRHLQLIAVLAAVPDQRAEIVDELRGGVVTHMRCRGERFVIDRATRGDRPGQPRRGRSFSLPEVGMYPRNIRRAAARREPRARQAAAPDSNINGLDQRLRPGCLPVDTHDFGLLDRLVQMIAFKPVALSSEDHRRLPASTPQPPKPTHLPYTTLSAQGV